MIKIIYKQDPLSENKVVERAVTLGQWPTAKYEHMPEHLRIFHNPSDMEHAEISVANEVTPMGRMTVKPILLILPVHRSRCIALMSILLLAILIFSLAVKL